MNAFQELPKKAPGKFLRSLWEAPLLFDVCGGLLSLKDIQGRFVRSDTLPCSEIPLPGWSGQEPPIWITAPEVRKFLENWFSGRLQNVGPDS
ncbi:MAG: hypothetical protein HY922_05035 [Elusimicrobia bacterium]|nr:hypothetical protein [Elusimicrobiota bacterium]